MTILLLTAVGHYCREKNQELGAPEEGEYILGGAQCQRRVPRGDSQLSRDLPGEEKGRAFKVTSKGVFWGLVRIWGQSSFNKARKADKPAHREPCLLLS